MLRIFLGLSFPACCALQGLLSAQEVRQRIRKKKIRDPIKWLSRHFPVPWKPKPRGHPILQVRCTQHIARTFSIVFSDAAFRWTPAHKTHEQMHTEYTQKKITAHHPVDTFEGAHSPPTHTLPPAPAHLVHTAHSAFTSNHSHSLVIIL